jgi:hypothetical protein
MVEYVTETNGEMQTWGDAPAPIASALAADFPQVERVVRMKRQGVKLFNQENVFEQVLVYADTGFFAMFTFPLQYGNPAALADPNAIILSAAMAEKYFGEEMPIGRTLMLATDDQERKQFIVQGVAQPFPSNLGFAFNLLTGYHPFTKRCRRRIGKPARSNAVFVQLRHLKTPPSSRSTWRVTWRRSMPAIRKPISKLLLSIICVIPRLKRTTSCDGRRRRLIPR